MPVANKAASTEHQEQCAVIDWARAWQRIHPCLEMLYAIPNGGHRHIAVARKLKSEGVKAGMPDLCLPIPRAGYHGLYVEMKTLRGKATEAQVKAIKLLRDAGYKAEVCHGSSQAIELIERYIKGVQV